MGAPGRSERFLRDEVGLDLGAGAPGLAAWRNWLRA
jgi:hypothetical protein